MAPKNDPTSLNASDHKFFVTIIKYLPMPAGMELDWDAFAKDMGFKDATIAKMRFGQIRRKYGSSKAAGNGTQDPLKATKSTKVTKPKKSKGAGKGRGKKGGEEYNHDDDDDEKVEVIKDDSGDEDKDVVKKEDTND
ncbi:hypothetical protein F4776DRAFT_220196 [Hypoxylon sp. NC0597]|nr:hypothetical protein F4776DRAFT_220196 [Hypoxylon sp. NC0597]